MRSAVHKHPARLSGILFAVILCSGLTHEATAQQKPALRKIEVVGLQRLSAEQVIATSGLKLGDPIDAQTLEVAADKLMRSGWFKNVNYSLHTVDDDTTVTFQVVEKAIATVPTTGDVFGEVIWNGNVALTSQELSTAFALRPGDSAARSRIDQGLQAARKAYGRRGYINAQITETSNRDAANRRMNYQFTVSEGQQYQMGNLIVTGISPADGRQLKSKWTLAPNATFDDSYPDHFSSTVIRPFVTSRAQRTGLRSKFEVSTKPDIQKQTVDVVITFK